MVHRSARFTSGINRPILKVGYSFVAIAILSAAACPTSPDDDSACGNDGHLIMTFGSAAQALTSVDLEVTLSGGVRTYSWGRVIENACSQEDVEVNYSLGVASDKLPPGWKVDAGYVITPVLGELVTMKPTNASTNVRNYDGSAKFGLRQAYGGQPGRFLPFLEISFTSQGNLQADQAVVQALFVLMQMNVYYKFPK